MKPAKLTMLEPLKQEQYSLQLDGLPAHTRNKIQAIWDSKLQWFQACQLLAETGDLTREETATVADQFFRTLRFRHGKPWADEVKRKARERFIKEQKQ